MNINTNIQITELNASNTATVLINDVIVGFIECEYERCFVAYLEDGETVARFESLMQAGLAIAVSVTS